MNKLIVIVGTLMILIVSNALAIGVSPGRVNVNFQPNLKEIVSYDVINNEHKGFKAVIYIKGELSEYVKLKEKEVEFSSDEETKTLSYEINLPNKIEKPGKHEVQVVVRELGGVEEGEIVIGTLVEVVSLLDINVPFPGKYISADLFIEEIDDKLKFIIPVKNLGTDDLERVKADIEIYDPNGIKVREASTNEKSINVNEEKELISMVGINEFGNYKAVVKIYYDEEVKVIEKWLTFGEFFIKLYDISVKDFTLGEIAKFNILVENVGNVIINESYANMKLFDDKDVNIMGIESNRVVLEPKIKKEMVAYWDTENIDKGTYKGSVNLNYEDKTKEHRIRTTVKEDAIETEIIGVTGLVVAEPGKVSVKEPIITILVTVIIVISIIWFVYHKKKKRKVI